MTENIKILIADDSELMRLLVKRFFSKCLVAPNISETKDLPDTINYLKKGVIDFFCWTLICRKETAIQIP